MISLSFDQTDPLDEFISFVSPLTYYPLLEVFVLGVLDNLSMI